MKENRNIFELILIYFIVILAHIALFLIVWFISNSDLYNFFFSFNLIMFIISPIYYYFNYFIEKIKVLKIEKELSANTIEFDYYREIIDNYSPAVLSLIHDNKISFEKDFLVSILYLQNKGWIKFENNKIKLLKKDRSVLNDNLKVILYNYDVILNDKLYVMVNGKKEDTKAGKFRKEWEKTIFNEVIDLGLIKERPETLSFLKYIPSIMFCLEAFLFYFIDGYDILVLLTLLMYGLYWYFSDLSFLKNKYFKTQKGYEIYAKLIGLKRFIKDFSKLSDREIEELELWNDYLIYEIMFNSNSKLSKDAKNLYNELIKEANKESK